MSNNFRYLNSCLLFVIAQMCLGAETSVTQGSIHEVPPIQVYSDRQIPLRPGEYVGHSIRTGDAPTAPATTSQMVETLPAIIPRANFGEKAAPDFLIRGQAAIQNRFYLEGIPLSDAQYNHASLSFIPIEMLSGADVYPDGIPIFLGGDGIGGAVNFRLHSRPADTRVRLGTRIGSFGYRRAYLQGLTREPLPVEFHLDYTLSNEDFPYLDDGGTIFSTADDTVRPRDHNGFSRLTLLPRIAFLQSRRHQLSYVGLTALAKSDIAGATRARNLGKLDETFHWSGLSHDWKPSDETEIQTTTSFRLSRQTLSRDQNDVSRIIPSDSTGTGFEVRSQGRTRFSGTELHLMGGLGRNNYSTELVARSVKLESGRWEIPAGIGTVIGDGWLKLRPSLLSHTFLYSSNSTENRPTYFLLSPRIGATADVSQLRLRSSTGLYHRAPSLSEIYGNPSGIVPNESLKQERGWRFDVGGDWSTDRFVDFAPYLKVSYTFFVSRVSDLISFTQVSSQSRMGINVGESRLIGHEFDSELATRFGLALRNGFAVLTSENLSDISYQRGNQLPEFAPFRWTSTLSFEQAPFGVSYRLSYFAPTYWDLANTKRLDGIIDHSLTASLATKDFGVFGFELWNIGDAISAESEYVDSGVVVSDNTTRYPGYPAPGRRFYVTWRYEL